MSRDASLDEFVGGSTSESADEEREESKDGEKSEEVAAEESMDEQDEDELSGVVDVSSASATYLWTPASDGCERCGDSVDRLWRCDGKLVCGECKEW